MLYMVIERFAEGLLRLRGRGFAVGQLLQQAPDGPGRPQFYDGGMLGRRAQDAQGGLYVHFPTGDRVQQNGVAAEETLPPGLLVRIAFPQGLLRPRPSDSTFEESPEGHPEGQPQPQDGVRLGEHQIMNVSVVTDADPALGAGIQRRLHVGAELVQGFYLPVGQPVDSIQLHNRQAESLPQGVAQGRLAGACGTPNGDARADRWSVVHSRGSVIYKPAPYKQRNVYEGFSFPIAIPTYTDKSSWLLCPSIERYIELLSRPASSVRQSDHVE